jgi:hypothetical protein
VGDWRASGPHLPRPAVEEILRHFCRQIFELFAEGDAQVA